MNVNKFKSYDATEQYRNIMKKIFNIGQFVYNKRTKTEVLQCVETPAILSVLLYCSFPILRNRKYYLNIAAAETAWQLKGTQDLTFINKHAPKLWSQFDDNADNRYVDYPYILNAQGYRWRKFFGREQIRLAIKIIKEDPTNRQIIVSSWDPGHDGLVSKAKNTHCLPFFNLRPCPVTKFLHMTVFSRSADMVLGFPYDLYNYSFLLYAFASSTEYKPGYLSFILNNYHVYKIPEHMNVLKKLIDRENLYTDYLYKFPQFTIDDIIYKPEKYVQWVKKHMYYDHNYKPKLELVL